MFSSISKLLIDTQIANRVSLRSRTVLFSAVVTSANERDTKMELPIFCCNGRRSPLSEDAFSGLNELNDLL